MFSGGITIILQSRRIQAWYLSLDPHTARYLTFTREELESNRFLWVIRCVGIAPILISAMMIYVWITGDGGN